MTGTVVGYSSAGKRFHSHLRYQDGMSSSKALTCARKCSRKSFQSSAPLARSIVLKRKFTLQEIAAFIKQEMDRRFCNSWHCVVGRNFGSYVTHETNHFIYLYVRNTAVMVFRTGC
ncbi:unnamed protein product [Haemonchus placei]|uniref:Dynein light chain n=1 Tax=Haemonchus placei TaxID=6290 RepID=A0A0N4W882_HAEPC|nr:unnamed protein product [Haemonchus placei]